MANYLFEVDPSVCPIVCNLVNLDNLNHILHDSVTFLQTESTNMFNPFHSTPD